MGASLRIDGLKLSLVAYKLTKCRFATLEKITPFHTPIVSFRTLLDLSNTVVRVGTEDDNGVQAKVAKRELINALRKTPRVALEMH